MRINSYNAWYGNLEINNIDFLYSLKSLALNPYRVMDDVVKHDEFLKLIKNTIDLVYLAKNYPDHRERMFARLLTAPSKDFLRIIGKDGYEAFEQYYPQMKQQILERIHKNPEEYHRIFYTYHSNKSSFFRDRPHFTYVNQSTTENFNEKLKKNHPDQAEKFAYKYNPVIGRRNSLT